MNYIQFKSRFGLKYMYVDINRDYDYVADSLFYKRQIPVKFMDEMVKEGDKYRVIFCSIKKKYQRQFEEALEELKDKMCLLGYNDYEEYCNNLMKELEEADA